MPIVEASWIMVGIKKSFSSSCEIKGLTAAYMPVERFGELEEIPLCEQNRTDGTKSLDEIVQGSLCSS